MPIDRDRIQRAADKLVRQNKLLAAIEQYSMILKESPSDLLTINKIGDLYARAGRPADALTHFRKIAAEYSQGGFLLKAIAIYKKILKLDPGGTESMIRLGDLYARQDLLKEAHEMYVAAAGHLLAKGDSAGTRHVYEKLLSVEPNVVDTRMAYAEFLERSGEKDALREQLVAAAELLVDQGRLSEGKEALARALKASREDPAAAAEILRKLMVLDEPGSIASQCEALLEGNPSAGELVEILVECHRTTGDEKASEEAVRQFIGDIRSPGPLTNLIIARIRAAEEDEDGAMVAAVRAVDDLAAAERRAESDSALDEMLELIPGSVPLMTRKLEILRMEGDRGATVGMMQRLVEAYTKAGMDDQASQMRRALATATGAPAAGGPAGRAAGPRKPAPREGESSTSPRDAEFVTEHLAEAEVFMRYGMVEKAIEQLDAVIARVPAHLEARRRLKSAHLEAGRRMRAVEESMAIAGRLAEQGRIADAVAELREALNLDPGNTNAAGMLSMLDSRAGAAGAAGTAGSEEDLEITIEEEAPAPAAAPKGQRTQPAKGLPAPPPSGSLIDLTEGLAESLAEALDGDDGGASEPGEAEVQSLSEVLKAFQESVDEEIGEEDFRTHFELGIAYKEMGLIDEAIGEFNRAAQDEDLFVDACGMLALCHVEKGDPETAERHYRKAIEAPIREGSESRRMGLAYELGEMLAAQGNWEGASEAFGIVVSIDAGYLDARERLEEAQRRLS